MEQVRQQILAFGLVKYNINCAVIYNLYLDVKMMGLYIVFEYIIDGQGMA